MTACLGQRIVCTRAVATATGLQQVAVICPRKRAGGDALAAWIDGWCPYTAVVLQSHLRRKSRSVHDGVRDGPNGIVRPLGKSAVMSATRSGNLRYAQRVRRLGRYQAALLGFASQYPGETPEARPGRF